MRLGRDGIAGLIGLAVSLGLLPFAFGLPKLPIVPIGPGFYPTIILIFVAACCALLLLQDVLVQRRAVLTPAPPHDAAAAAPSRAYGLVAGAFLLTGAYIAVLPLLGFRIATALYVAIFQFMLERPRTARQWLVLAAVAVGTSGLVYIAFDKYLSVLLPRGTWTGW
jgi:putative tricarboxylic transport membrane protein